MPIRYRAVALGLGDASRGWSLRHRWGQRDRRFSIGAYRTDTDRLVCVAVALPPSQGDLDDGVTLEITRVSAGAEVRHADAWAFLLARAARLARRRGTERLVTSAAIADTLRAGGWLPVQPTQGELLGRPGRPGCELLVWRRADGANVGLPGRGVRR